MKFGGKSYDTQLISVSEEMEQNWPIGFHKIAADVMFSQIVENFRYGQMQAKNSI